MFHFPNPRPYTTIANSFAQSRQENAARLKRKALDARLKEQKIQSRPLSDDQAINNKRQKLNLPISVPPLALPPPPSKNIQQSRTEISSAEPADIPTPTNPTTTDGFLSPTSSTTLSLQFPSSHPDPSHPINRRIGPKSRKPPLLLPQSLLEEVARLPSPPAPEPTYSSLKPKPNLHKKLADFEAEQKLAQEILDRKLRKKQKKMGINKGPVKVAVLGREEERERERRVMAPPVVARVERVKDIWLMGRKSVAGERRAVPVGGGMGRPFVRAMK